MMILKTLIQSRTHIVATILFQFAIGNSAFPPLVVFEHLLPGLLAFISTTLGHVDFHDLGISET